MKKIFTFLGCIAVAISANAQFTQALKSHDIFNHLGLGVGIGTPGISIQAGTTITPWVQLRAGVDIMPTFKLNTSLDLEEFDGTSSSGMPFPEISEVDVQGKLSNTTGHFLFDVFPIPHLTSFHITVGGYFGGKKIIKAYNTNAQTELRDVWMYNNRQGQYSGVPMDYGKLGVALGDYFIEPDQNGNLNASIKVTDFRPYVGLGFGRIVPNSRINCLFDLGVQFWGHPQVWNDTSNMRLTSEGANGDDGGVLKIISKVSVYPVLSVSIVGKIL